MMIWLSSIMDVSYLFLLAFFVCAVASVCDSLSDLCQEISRYIDGWEG